MRRIVIAGGGYAGVSAARSLAALLDPSWEITLVDRGHAHALLTRLPEVVAGRVASHKAAIPYGLILPHRVLMREDEIVAVDLTRRRIVTSSGALDSEYLVMAVGAVSDDLEVPRARELALPLRSVADAVAVRERLRLLSVDRRTSRIVVVGAGYTGSEIAAELLEMRNDRGEQKFEVTLVAEDLRLLPRGNERLGAVAEAKLRTRGATLLLGKSIGEVRADTVVTVSGERLPADAVVWAARSRPAWPRTVGSQTIRVPPPAPDETLRIAGAERVYVAGDASGALDYATGLPVAANAQFAIQEGQVAAKNIAADVLDERPTAFRPRSPGEALSLGPVDGVAEILGFIVKGRAALAVKDAALARYLYRLGGTDLLRRFR